MLEDNNNNKRNSLGKGLEAILGDKDFVLDDLTASLDLDNTNSVQKISIDSLTASPFQPRMDFDEDALETLSLSIKEKGILQPLLVRQKMNGKYEIIAGERRYRAALKAGLKEVPVMIKEMSDKEVLEVALIENIQRENLSPIEEAESLNHLIKSFSHTQESLSQVIGKSRSYIANTLRLLSLPQSVQQMVRENILTAGHVRPLIGLENAEEIAEKIIKKGLNVRQVEELVQQAKDTTPKIKKTKSQDITDIEKNIKQHLGLKVKISTDQKGGGKVVLAYSDLSELDKILDILRK
ncbi:MAG: ParB/RepB/Spo0J family partition protein [Alphaproteobacteria bacterium]|nr:ParB/RepB/Spo0J family partition protein [Alphaproteobacteria bacterium]